MLMPELICRETMLSDENNVRSSTAPGSHALQWRTSLPYDRSVDQRSTYKEQLKQQDVHHQASSDADWAEGSRRPSDSADDGHVHWASTRPSQHHQHDEMAEEAHHRALGMSRRGSFFPGHSQADEYSSHTGHFGREDNCRSHPKSQDYGHASAPGNAGNSAIDASRSSSHDVASTSLGYQPYSLKDYRENDYDPKHRSYWMLGTLGKDPDTAETQVGPDIANPLTKLDGLCPIMFSSPQQRSSFMQLMAFPVLSAVMIPMANSTLHIKQKFDPISWDLHAEKEGEFGEGAGLVSGHTRAEPGCQVILTNASTTPAGAEEVERTRACSGICKVGPCLFCPRSATDQSSIGAHVGSFKM